MNPVIIVSEEKKTKQDKTVPKEEHCASSLHMYSFFTISTIASMNINLNAPFPIDLPYSGLVMTFPENLMEGYVIKDQEGVFSTNKDIVKKQSGLLTDIITRFTKGLMQGGAISLSLPIRIFEPRTMLERDTDWWAFAPVILKKAGACSNKLEALKHVICFSLSGLFRSTQQLKPFNPMLGETYQAFWEDGSKIYMEHTSHIPPISNFYIKDSSDLFRMNGYFHMEMEGMMKSMFTNAMTIVPKGRINIILPETMQTISYQVPRITLGGLFIGQRYVLFNGHMKFEDRDNGLKAVIYFNQSHSKLKGKRVHDFYGQICNYDYSKNTETEFYEDSIPYSPFQKGKETPLSVITGSWLESVSFDDKLYWSIKDNTAPQVFPEKEVLPSDCRYREDKKWLYYSTITKDYEKLYEEYAQKWKLALEAQQRYERLLRQIEKEKRLE